VPAGVAAEAAHRVPRQHPLLSARLLTLSDRQLLKKFWTVDVPGTA